MTETKHTPGPWNWTLDEGQYWVESSKGHIASLISSEANAALIAAAPGLLEALNEAIVDGDSAKPNHQWKVKARAAIAKATSVQS